MSPVAAPQGPDDAQSAELQPEPVPADSLIWWLRAIYRCRWLCFVGLVVGFFGGIVATWNTPRYQTAAVLRLASAAVGYQQAAYWQGRASTVAVQLRAWANAADSQGSLVVRPENIPWMLRIEILHPEPGAGKVLLERLLNRLRTIQATSGGSIDQDSQGQVLGHELHQLMNQFQQQLLKLQREAGLPPVLAESSELVVGGAVLPGEADTRLPYYLLPHVQRYRQLMLTADQYFSAGVRESAEVPSVRDQQRLLETQRLLAQKLLAFRGSLDLMQVALGSETAVLDEVEERQMPFLKVLSQWLFLGGGVGACVTVLLAASWVLVADSWHQIRTSAGLRGS